MLNDKNFLEIKEYIESIFNCEVTRLGTSEINTQIIGYRFCFQVDQNGDVNQAEFPNQPKLTIIEKGLLIFAYYIIKDTIKTKTKIN